MGISVSLSNVTDPSGPESVTLARLPAQPDSTGRMKAKDELPSPAVRTRSTEEQDSTKSRSPPIAQAWVTQPSSAQLKWTSSARSIENVFSRSTPN